MSFIIVVNCDRRRILPEEPFREFNVYLGGPFWEEKPVLILFDALARFDRIVNFSLLKTGHQAVYSGEAFASEKIHV